MPSLLPLPGAHGQTKEEDDLEGPKRPGFLRKLFPLSFTFEQERAKVSGRAGNTGLENRKRIHFPRLCTDAALTAARSQIFP